MNRNIKFLFILLIFNFNISCSFDNKTGLWTGEENEKKRADKLEEQQNIEIIKIYSSENIYSKEISPTRQVILSEPKKNFSWLTSGKNLQNSLGNIYLSGIKNNFLKKRIGKDKFTTLAFRATPLIFEDKIFYSDDAGTIFCISKNGKIFWKKNIYKKIYKKIYKTLTFSIDAGFIYVADNLGFLYSINLNDGKIEWIKNHGIPIKSNVKIFKNKIFVINQDNRLLAFDKMDGKKLWDVRSISSFIKPLNHLGLGIDKNGLVVMLGSSGDLLKVNSKGRVIWSRSISGSISLDENVFFESSDLNLIENEIIFSSSRAIFSINSLNAYTNWQQNMKSTSTPIVDGENVFVVTDNGFLVNIERKTGEIIYSTEILKILKKRKQKTYISGFILGSGKIYITTLNGHLIICSASTGKVEFFKNIGDRILTGPIINEGSLYILTEKSRILGFN